MKKLLFLVLFLVIPSVSFSTTYYCLMVQSEITTNALSNTVYNYIISHSSMTAMKNIEVVSRWNVSIATASVNTYYIRAEIRTKTVKDRQLFIDGLTNYRNVNPSKFKNSIMETHDCEDNKSCTNVIRIW